MKPNGRLKINFVFLFLLSFLIFNVAQAQSKPPQDTFIQHLLNPILNLPADLESGFVTPENKPNWAPMSIILGTTLSALTLHRVEDEPFGNSTNAPRLGGASKRISDIGLSFALSLPVGFYISGALLPTGYVRSHAFDVGEQLVETLLLTGASTAVVKFMAGRPRPDQSDRKSLPSRHASLVFASATTLALNSAWYVGIPTLLGGGLVGAARMDLHKHYFSDVIIGAGIGAFFSTSAWLQHRAQKNKQKLAWSPWAGSDSMGLTFIY